MKNKHKDIYKDVYRKFLTETPEETLESWIVRNKLQHLCRSVRGCGGCSGCAPIENFLEQKTNTDVLHLQQVESEDLPD